MDGRLDFMIDFENESKIAAFEDFVSRLKKYINLIDKLKHRS